MLRWQGLEQTLKTTVIDICKQHTVKISAKNVGWFSSYSITSLKISSKLSASKYIRLAKQVKFQIDITFEVVKILSLNFQDFFKSLNSVREPLLKRFGDGKV